MKPEAWKLQGSPSVTRASAHSFSGVGDELDPAGSKHRDDSTRDNSRADQSSPVEFMTIGHCESGLRDSAAKHPCVKLKHGSQSLGISARKVVQGRRHGPRSTCSCLDENEDPKFQSFKFSESTATGITICGASRDGKRSQWAGGDWVGACARLWPTRRLVCPPSRPLSLPPRHVRSTRTLKTPPHSPDMLRCADNRLLGLTALGRPLRRPYLLFLPSAFLRAHSLKCPLAP